MAAAKNSSRRVVGKGPREAPERPKKRSQCHVAQPRTEERIRVSRTAARPHPQHGTGMRRFLQGRQKAAATEAAVRQDPPTQSLAAASSSTKSFPAGIKLLHSPEDAIVECVHLCCQSLAGHSLMFPV